MKTILSAAFISCLFFRLSAQQTQVLTLKDAIGQSLANYSTIKARESYLNASKATLQQARRDYLPNLVLSAQQDYGTINGQNGPLYGYGGFGVASSGLPLNEQNWNAAFGALYLANINWELFSFGRTRARINIARSTVEREQNDLVQEQFQHQVKVASAYLNLLASQRIVSSQQKNLDRAVVFRDNTITRARTGLIAGVDSSLANAEVSGARIALIKARDAAQEQAARLAVLMGVAYKEFVLDTAFVTHAPQAALAPATLKTHPVLSFYQSRINVGNEQLRFYNRSYYPSFSVFGIVQDRGSGFEAAYTQDRTAFTRDYVTGITPTRGNYLLGVGMTWNLTTIARNSAQVRSQRFIVDALKHEYDLADQQLRAQLALADARILNAMDNYNEAPVQVKAASDAYMQKLTLYRNGLATIVEVTQAMYALNRAETDRDIAYTNLWQALLLKAASSGELPLFTNEF